MNNQFDEKQNATQIKSCLDYFRSYSVFDSMLRGFREKYDSYGNFSGKVILKALSEEDIDVLEGFFSKSFHGQKSVTISAENFKRALKNSCFDLVEPKELLENYFREKMTGKKERRQNEEGKLKNIFEKYSEIYENTPAFDFVNELLSLDKSKEGLKYILKVYRDSERDWNEVERVVKLSAEIINNFPYRQEKLEYLAVFAAFLTGNPHAFDDGTCDSQLLKLLINRDIGIRGIEISSVNIFPAMKKQLIYMKVGILRDDTSNYAMLSGVLACKKDGTLHKGMEGFLAEGDMVHVPLNVISGWEKISCPNDEIFIVENPSIYAMLCAKYRGGKACMCMNGQPRLSSVLVLDLLAKTDTRIYYAGDFDPEGLLIAQKIKQYYKGKFSYWHMSEEAYEMSNPTEIISEKRLKILDKISDEDLKPTAESLRKRGRAGYQEQLFLRLKKADALLLTIM
jgi:uncharacterized protein (TIGR02679 family)